MTRRSLRGYAAIGAASAAIAVVAGAFGAHALTEVVTPERLETFKTAAYYQLVHSIGLLVIGLMPSLEQAGRWPARLLLGGIVLFSGSLYALVLLDIPAFGAITPFGGLAFISGWAFLAWSIWKNTDAA